MAGTQEKIYRITIQSDAAGQEVEVLRKKLAALDKQLEGLDQGSDAARAIVADMAKVAAELDAAESQVERFNQALDGLKPGTIGALNQELKDLKAQLAQVAEGSAEADAILARMGEVRGSIKGLRDEVKALDPEKRIQAFNSLASGVVGAFGIMTTAAQTFGLESSTADQFTKKTMGVIAVLQSLEAIRAAADGETLKSIKSTLKLADAYIFSGTAAEGASKTTKAALLSTGIGILLVLVGLLVSNFDKLKDAGSSIYQKWKPGFDAIGKVLGVLMDGLRNVASFLTGGLVDDAAKHALAVATEARQKELAAQAEHTARLLEILKARGDDTLALEVENARRRLASLKNSTAEEKKAYQDATKDYLVLKAQLQKRADDEEKAAWMAHLNGLAALQAARGADAFRAQLAAKREQLAQLLQAEADGQHISQAQLLQAQNEIDAAQEAHDTAQEAKRRALQMARLNAALALTEANGRLGLAQLGTQGQDELTLALKTNAQKLVIARQAGRDLLAQAQRDGAAIKQNETEQYTLGIQRAQLYAQQQVLALQEDGHLRQKVQEAILNSAQQREQKFLNDGNAARAAAARVTERIAAELAADLENKRLLYEQKMDMWGNLLTKLFGIDPKKTEELKQKMAEQFATISNSLNSLTNDLFSAATQQTEAALAAAQQQLQEISSQLSEAQNQANSTAQQLATAEGSRRDFLLRKLQAERAETERLAAAKAKAAAEEQKQTQAKHELEKKSAELAAASALATNLATAAEAVYAGVKAVSKGTELPFPANLLAIVAGIAAVGAAISSARQLAAATKYESGGLLNGPSHAQGGMPFSVSGRGLAELEGGEFVVRKSIVARPGMLPLLHLINESAGATVLPHPRGSHFAAGGQVPSLPTGTVAIPVADLNALLDTNRAMLSHLQGIHSATLATEQHTEATAAYGPPVLEFGYDAELKRQQLAQTMQQAQQMGRL